VNPNALKRRRNDPGEPRMRNGNGDNVGKSTPGEDVGVILREEVTYNSLSSDILNHISKYHPDLPHTMGALNRHTRWAMSGARKSLTVTEDNIDEIISEYGEKPNILQTVLEMKLILSSGLSRTLRQKLLPLYIAGRVLAMHITFQKEDVKFGEDGYSCRLALMDIFNDLQQFTPFLEELKLDFSALGDHLNNFMRTTPGFKVGFDGCAEISGLPGKLPALLTLSLQLNGNEIGDLGLTMLTQMNHRTLKTLYLGLKNNNIGSESMVHLLAIATATTQLQALYVDLEDNHIGTLGAIWLSQFGESRYSGVLRTLHLGLQNNSICDIGAIVIKQNLLRVPNSLGLREIPRDSRSSLIDSPGLQLNL
jgi:hypothetical protein